MKSFYIISNILLLGNDGNIIEKANYHLEIVSFFISVHFVYLLWSKL